MGHRARRKESSSDAEWEKKALERVRQTQSPEQRSRQPAGSCELISGTGRSSHAKKMPGRCRLPVCAHAIACCTSCPCSKGTRCSCPARRPEMESAGRTEIPLARKQTSGPGARALRSVYAGIGEKLPFAPRRAAKHCCKLKIPKLYDDKPIKPRRTKVFAFQRPRRPGKELDGALVAQGDHSTHA